MCMGEVARCCSTPHAAMNSDEASLVCESSMDFGLLFGDEVTTGKEGMHHQREEYRTFLYLRVLRRLCASDEPRQRKLHEHVRAAVRSGALSDDRHELLDAVCGELCSHGYGAFVSHSRGSGAAGLLSFRHSFIQVSVDNGESVSGKWSAASNSTLVIEPQLREEFQIVRPTPQYQRMLEALPREFVGTSSQLAAIVEFMSERMAESFRHRGMCSPPWRQV
mmetsp:Transcript_28598/g.54009  ORF Transcript_28598/g.54009 Transcript_28598/m.54009 type:complete len:221 (+) Transcript_28598:308-970(+)